jgi:hypothetical protein
MTDLLSLAQPLTREFRPYTRSGVFKAKLSPAQIRLLEKAGHGGFIVLDATGSYLKLATGETRPAPSPVAWTSLRSMADKGAVEIVEREIHHTSRGPVNGRIIAVRVK